MNEGLEKVKERLDENEIGYIEEDNTLIIDNYNKEIGLSIRYRLVVADDALTLLLCLDQDITENYKDLMKSNWSEEVL